MRLIYRLARNLPVLRMFEGMAGLGLLCAGMQEKQRPRR